MHIYQSFLHTGIQHTQAAYSLLASLLVHQNSEKHPPRISYSASTTKFRKLTYLEFRSYLEFIPYDWCNGGLRPSPGPISPRRSCLASAPAPSDECCYCMGRAGQGQARTCLQGGVSSLTSKGTSKTGTSIDGNQNNDDLGGQLRRGKRPSWRCTSGAAVRSRTSGGVEIEVERLGVDEEVYRDDRPGRRWDWGRAMGSRWRNTEYWRWRRTGVPSYGGMVREERNRLTLVERIGTRSLRGGMHA